MAANKSPPKGGKPDKLMRDALMLALKREATDANGQKTNNLNRIATKLVDLAAEGDLGAIKEIGDRVDGRPAQMIQGDQDAPVGLIIKWADANPDH